MRVSPTDDIFHIHLSKDISKVKECFNITHRHDFLSVPPIVNNLKTDGQVFFPKNG